jgi:hypothetical protein
MYFTHKKQQASTIVMMMFVTSFFCSPSCALRTAHAAVKLLTISTPVFTAPQKVSR